MAETAALVLATATAFKDAVDCFHYIQIARNFDVDYQTSVFRLRNAELRFSRWGQAVGLYGVITKEDVGQVQQALGAGLDSLVEAKKQLEHIERLFKMARQTSNGAHDTTGADVDELNEQMHQICLSRRKHSLSDRVKWALSGRDQLDRLLDSVTCLIEGLEILFPAAEQGRVRLAKQEASGLRSYAEELRDRLEKLEDGQRDQKLRDAVRETLAMPAGVSSSVRDITNHFGDHNSGVQAGQNFGGIVLNR